MAGADTSRALAILSKFQNKLKNDGYDDHAQSLSRVQDMVQHPVFNHLLNVQSSMPSMIEQIKAGVESPEISTNGNSYAPDTMDTPHSYNASNDVVVNGKHQPNDYNSNNHDVDYRNDVPPSKQSRLDPQEADTRNSNVNVTDPHHQAIDSQNYPESEQTVSSPYPVENDDYHHQPHSYQSENIQEHEQNGETDFNDHSAENHHESPLQHDISTEQYQDHPYVNDNHESPLQHDISTEQYQDHQPYVNDNHESPLQHDIGTEQYQDHQPHVNDNHESPLQHDISTEQYQDHQPYVNDNHESPLQHDISTEQYQDHQPHVNDYHESPLQHNIGTEQYQDHQPYVDNHESPLQHDIGTEEYQDHHPYVNDNHEFPLQHDINTEQYQDHHPYADDNHESLLQHDINTEQYQDHHPYVDDNQAIHESYQDDNYHAGDMNNANNYDHLVHEVPVVSADLHQTEEIPTHEYDINNDDEFTNRHEMDPYNPNENELENHVTPENYIQYQYAQDNHNDPHFHEDQANEVEHPNEQYYATENQHQPYELDHEYNNVDYHDNFHHDKSISDPPTGGINENVEHGNQHLNYRESTYPSSIVTEVIATSAALSTIDDDHDFQEAMQVAAQGRTIEAITLHKPPTGGLGFSVVGLNSESHGELGIFIQEIRPNGAAALDGRLQESDQILAINRVRIDSGLPHHDAIKLLQQASGQVELVVARGESTESPYLSRSSSITDDHINDVHNRTMSTRSAASQLSANIQNRDGPKWRQLELITLYNDGSGLGCGIIGGRNAGVLIKSILKDLAADRDGRLKSGDQLLQIDDVVLKGMASEQVAGVFKQCSSTVNLIVSRQTPYDSPLGDRIHSTTPLKTYDIDVDYTPHEGLNVLVGGYIDEQMNESFTGLFIIDAANGDVTSISHKLQKTDQIIKVNGTTVIGESALTICDLLRNSGNRIVLTMADSSPDEQDEILAIEVQSELVPEVHDESPVAEENELPLEVEESLPPENNVAKQPISVDVPEEINLTQMGLVETALSGLETNGCIDDNTLAAIKAKWQEKIGLDKTIIIAEICNFDSTEGLGISLEAKSLDTASPEHIIRSITKGGIIDRNNSLVVYDKLLEVNGSPISELSDKDVIDVIHCLPPYVYIVAAREMQPIEEVTEYQTVEEDKSAIEFSFMDEDDESDTQEIVPTEQSENIQSVEVAASHARPVNRKASLEQFASTANWRNEAIVIDLVKDNQGLGFSLLDYYSISLNSKIILIRNVVKGGVADTDGRIQPGDRLVSVNDKSLENSTLDYAVELLKSAPRGIVHIGIIKPIVAPPQRMASSLIMESVPESASEQHDMESGDDHPTPMVKTKDGSYRDKRPSPLILSERDGTSSEPDIPSYVENITIDKGKSGLGLNIMCDDDGYGAIIKNILAGGAVENDGRLEIGDIIMAINNISVIGLSSIKSRAILRRCTLQGEQITFGVLRKNLIGKVPVPEAADYSPTKKLSIKRKTPSPSPKNVASSKAIDTVAEVAATEAAVADVAIASSLIAEGNNSNSKPIQEEAIVASQHEVTKDACMPDFSKLDMQQENYQNDAVDAGVAVAIASPMSYTNADTVDDSTATTFQLSPSHKVVELYRDPKTGLGIGIAAGVITSNMENSEGVKGIFIRQIREDSPAGRCGQLLPGDRLLQVNDIDVSNATHSEVIAAIRNSPDPVRILVQGLVNENNENDTEMHEGQERSSNPEEAIVAGSLAASNNLPSTKEETEAPAIPENVATNEHQPDIADTIPLAMAVANEHQPDGTNELNENPDDNIDLSPEELEKEQIMEKYNIDRGEIFIVPLFKGSGGLGISVTEKKYQELPRIYVANIKPDGPAGIDGQIDRGDELLEVNGMTLRGKPHKEAMVILKSVTADVKLIVYRPLWEKERRSSTLRQETPTESVAGTIKNSASSDSLVVPGSRTIADPSSIASPSESTLIVTLIKDRLKGLGVAVGELRGTEKNSGHYIIKNIAEGGVAARDGRLKVGDRLLSVNRKSITDLTYQEAIETLKEAEGAVTLTVSTTNLNVNSPISPFASLPRNFEGMVRSSDHGDSQRESTGTTPTNVSPAETPVVKTPPTEFDEVISLRTCPIIPGKETVIEIDKGESGLGITIIGGANTLLGATVIYKIYEDGATHKDGRLQIGDHILEVNGVNLRKADHDAAITALRIAPPVVKLLVYRENADNTTFRDDILDVFNVELRRNASEGLGFSIIKGGTENEIFISEIANGGLAEKDGRLLEGDQIVAINGVDVRKQTPLEATGALKDSQGTVHLTISRLKAGSVAGSIMSAWPSTSSLIGNGLHSSTDSLLGTNAIQKPDPKVKVVQLLKRSPQDSLGLSFSGGAGSALGDVPITVVIVRPGSLAAQNGEIKVNDQILKINGQSLDGLTDVDVVKMLKKASGVVTLHVLSSETDSTKTRIPSSTSSEFAASLSPRDMPTTIDTDTSAPKESRQVVLERGVDGLGFSIVGGNDSIQGKLPIFIKQVFPWGAASRSQELKAGDQLLSANGHSLLDVSHEEAVNILKGSKGSLILIVAS